MSKFIPISLQILLLFFFSCKQETEIKHLGSCYMQEDAIIKYLNKSITGNIDTIDLIDANPENFKIILNNKIEKECLSNDVWAKDKMSVWFKQYKIQGADPVSFHLIGNAYALDNKNIFYKNEILINADINSFQILDNFYAKDNNKIWYKGKEVFGIENIKEFIVIDGYFSADVNNIYLNKDTFLLKIPNSDAKTFKSIDNSNNFSSIKYYKDKDKIYYVDTQKNIGEKDFLHVFEAFTENFKILKEKFYSKDNFNVYFKNKIIENADIITFKPIGNNYGKDKTKIYFKNKIMYGIDYKTFEVIKSDTTDAKDSLNYYYKGKKLQK